jgi:hypothetical protein
MPSSPTHASPRAAINLGRQGQRSRKLNRSGGVQWRICTRTAVSLVLVCRHRSPRHFLFARAVSDVRNSRLRTGNCGIYHVEHSQMSANHLDFLQNPIRLQTHHGGFSARNRVAIGVAYNLDLRSAARRRGWSTNAPHYTGIRAGSLPFPSPRKIRDDRELS